MFNTKILDGPKSSIGNVSVKQLVKERQKYLEALVSIYLLMKLGPDQEVTSVLDEYKLMYDQIENIILTALGGTQ